MRTNAEAIAATLADAGIQTAFGLPGGEITVLLDACRKHGIRFFLTGHEASAAFMADVTGQITGQPGVCLATLGPGAVNLSLGVANALLDRSPVLAITAQLSTALEDHFPHQRLPLDRFFGAIAKGSTILNGRGTEDAVRSAIALATSEPHGPVHLGLPSNLAGVAVEPGQAPAARSGARGPARGVALEEVGAAVSAAKRPLVLVGLGARPHDAPALRSLVDRTRLPFVVTPKAKGILPEDAPGFLGVASGMAADNAVLETLGEADLLLGVGFDPVECDKDWYAQRPVAGLSRASTAEGTYRPLEAIGDIAEMLPGLAAQVRAAPWPDDVVAACRARVRPEPAPAGRGLSPIACIRAMRKVAPRDAVLACDVGSHKYFAGQFWESYEPHTFFMSNGLSAMGYGIPAAIAAKLRVPREAGDCADRGRRILDDAAQPDVPGAAQAPDRDRLLRRRQPELDPGRAEAARVLAARRGLHRPRLCGDRRGVRRLRDARDLDRPARADARGGGPRRPAGGRQRGYRRARVRPVLLARCR